MKTAKAALSTSAFLAALGFVTAFGIQPSAAQTGSAAPAVNSPAPSPALVSAAANVAPVTPAPLTPAAAPSPSMPVMPATADAAADKDKALNTMEDKVPEAAKQAMKNLDNPTADITLDDLNSARQAIAKIDALIEIEKRLTELQKIKDEREGGGSASMAMNNRFAGAIPASALSPLPLPAASSSAPPPMQVGFMDSNSIEVTRIMGSDSHYSAMVKTPDGQTKTVHVGDKLSDGSSIVAISSTGVEFGGREKHVIHVKNVNTVFGGTQ